MTSLDVSVYPDEQLHLVDTQTNPATCWWWQRNDGEPRASTSVVSGPSIPVPADQAGKVVRWSRPTSPAGRPIGCSSGRITPTIVISTGNDPAAATQETLWWVSESGVRFGVERNQETLGALGLSTPPKPAPWSVLRLLAPGPTLSKADALVRHDALPVDVNVGELEQPK